MTSLQKSIAGVVAFVALVVLAIIGVKVHDHRVAENALLHQRIGADSARADSAERVAAAAVAREDSSARRESHWHAVADSLHVALARDSIRLARLSPRIRIAAPGVVEIASAAITPASPPSIDTVRVPPVLTNFMQLQAAQIAELRLSLAVADSGWAAADSLAAARAFENTALRDANSALHDENASLRRIKQPRLGFKSGLVVGLGLTLLTGLLIGLVD